ncbi:MAG TPA: hypothetical protein VM580_25965, partial [Labilithrix sp.]|nr:hypothetical protein [Labilithrix sp.]
TIMAVFSMRAKAAAWTMSVVAAATFASMGCDDHDDGDHDHTDGGHGSEYPSCNAISEACHEVDIGEGRIHECHEVAHSAKSDSDCSGVKNECVTTCAAAKADAGSSTDAGDGGGEHAGH